MKKLVTLKKDYSIKLSSNVTKHLQTKYVYLPMDEMINITENKEVKKEQTLGFRIPSPISGVIAGTKYCINEKGELKKCVAILNDYKETLLERRAMRKNLTKLSFETMVEELNEFGHFDLAEKLKEKNQVLILNGIEDEPYVANEIFINKEYTKEILETMDFLREAGSFEKNYIIIKNNDSETIESYTTFLGTYTNIDLLMVPDFYLLGKKEFLLSYLNLSPQSLMLKPSEILKIHQTIKRRRLNTENYLTITGDCVKKPQIMVAKMGTPVKELIDCYIKIKKNVEPTFIVNGLMTGKELDISNLIVTEELKSILIMEKDSLKEKACWNCGKCVAICPKNCNPKEMLDKKDPKYIKNCIDCGLCSYICPAFINLRKVIKGEENE